jgi:hypothetical protein
MFADFLGEFENGWEGLVSGRKSWLVKKVKKINFCFHLTTGIKF